MTDRILARLLARQFDAFGQAALPSIIGVFGALMYGLAVVVTSGATVDFFGGQRFGQWIADHLYVLGLLPMLAGGLAGLAIATGDVRLRMVTAQWLCVAWLLIAAFYATSHPAVPNAAAMYLTLSVCEVLVLLFLPGPRNTGAVA